MVRFVVWSRLSSPALACLMAVGIVLQPAAAPPSAAQTVITTVPAGTNPQRAAVNFYSKKVFVTNTLSNSVTVIDELTNAVIGTVPVPAGAYGIAVNSNPFTLSPIGPNPAYGRVYVTSGPGSGITGPGFVTVIDGEANPPVVLTAVAVGRVPLGIDVDLATGKVYVGNTGDNTVSVISGSSNTVVGTPIPLQASPLAVSIDPVGKRAYVIAASQNPPIPAILYAIDTEADAVAANYFVTNGGRFVRVNPSNKKVYISEPSNGLITVFDTTTGTTTPIALGSIQPYDIALNPVPTGTTIPGLGTITGSNHLYVATSATNSLTVIDPATNTVIGGVASGGTEPQGVAYDPITGKVFLVNSGSNNVTIYQDTPSTPTGVGNLTFITPTRVVDTRPSNPAAGITTTGFNESGNAIVAGAIPGGQVRRFKVGNQTFGNTTFPADTSGLLLNVTIVGGPSGGFLTVFPGNVADASRPNASTVNPSTSVAANFWATGVPVLSQPNAGTIAVFASVTLDVVIDVVGYYSLSGGTGGVSGGSGTPAGNLRFIPPVRVIDTRPTDAAAGITNTGFDPNGNPVPARPFNAGETRRFKIGGQSFAPANGSPVPIPADATGIVAHVTSIAGSPLGGFITLFPGNLNDAERPNASTLNPSTAIAFNTTELGIPSTGAGQGSVAIYSTNALDIAVDLLGYYTASTVPPPPGAVNAGNLTLITPLRVVDTRGAPDGPIGFELQPGGNFFVTTPRRFNPGETRRFKIAGSQFGSFTFPNDIKGVLINVTVVGGPSGGFVTAFPGDIADANRPNTSTVNPSTAVAASFWANYLPVSPAANAGTEAIFATVPIDAIVDVVGYYQ